VADAAQLTAAAPALTATQDAVTEAAGLAVALLSRTRTLSDTVLDDVATIDAANLTLNAAEAVVLTVAIVLIPSVIVPSTPKALVPYVPVPNPVR
jgi:hypothetical protein